MPENQDLTVEEIKAFADELQKARDLLVRLSGEKAIQLKVGYRLERGRDYLREAQDIVTRKIASFYKEQPGGTA